MDPVQVSPLFSLESFIKRTSVCAWLVVVVFWLYVVVLVLSCLIHWWQIYKRVQLNRARTAIKKTSRTRSPMARSMFSITALERSATSVLEMSKGSSSVRYTELRRLKVVKRSRSDSAVLEQRKRSLEYKTFHV